MTNWRNMNPINKAAWDITLLNAGSPLYPTRDECYAAAGDLSGLALAMMHVESQYGVAWNHNDPSSFNVLNLRPRGGLEGFQRFSSWAEGIAEFRARLLDPLYAYVISNDIPSLIHLFAPASDDNDERAYASSVEADLARWNVTEKEATMALYAVAGLPVKIESSVPIIIDLIPTWQTNQRPGITRQLPGAWVQHETDNDDVGADAEMHSRYLKNGAEGRHASWHFTVDDGVIYQHLPVNEVGWHAADGGGPGNMGGIASELCVNRDGDKTRSRHNAEALSGGVMKALLMGPNLCKRHWDYNAGSADRHHCPDLMMTEGYWPTFVRNVTTIINGTSVVYAKPSVPGWLGDPDELARGIDRSLNGAKAYALRRSYTTKVNAPRWLDSEMKQKVGPDIPRGTSFVGEFIYRIGSNWFILTPFGTRVEMSKVKDPIFIPKAA